MPAKRRHYYQRRYYYKEFKKSMDRAYRWAAIASFIGGLAAMARFHSFWIGLVFLACFILYHAVFIVKKESILAYFWGEAQGGWGAVLLLRMIQWVSTMAIIVWLIIGFLTNLTAGRKEYSATSTPATDPPANSSGTAQGPTPSPTPNSAQSPAKADSTKADCTDEGHSPSSRDTIERREPVPDPLLLISLEGVDLPATVTSIAPFSLLDPAGKDVAIPVNSIIKVVKRSEHGTLTLEIQGTVFVGHEDRLADKVRMR